VNAQDPRDSDDDDDDDDISDDDDDVWEDSFIIGGTTQSSALIWSIQTGRIVNKLLVDRVRREQSIVWSVATLADGTCVLGDSLGHVSFFDAKTYTLLHGAKFAAHGRNADVLALCVGPDGRSVYSASVDQKVIEYALLGSGRAAKWVTTGKRRLHAHDIRAIGIDPPYNPRRLDDNQSPRLPVLVTGGVDFHLVLTPASSPSSLTSLTAPKLAKVDPSAKANLQARKITAHDYVNPISSTAVTTFADTIHRRLPFVPSTGRGSAIGGGSVVRVCRERRWLVLRREKSVAIWKLPAEAEAEQDGTVQEGWLKVLEIQAKTKTNLVTVEVSDSGRWLFLSDLYESKLFELIGEDDDVVPKRIRSFSAAFDGHQGLAHCPGASAACFTPDSGRVIVASQPGSYLHIVELPKESKAEVCKLLKSFAEHRQATSSRAMAGKLSNGGRANGTRRDVTLPENKKSTGRPSEPDSDDIDDEMAEEDEVDMGVSLERSTFSRIDHIGISPDGQYIVSVDTAKRLHCYSLDTLHHHGVMPSPAQQPNAIAFNPWRPSTICCVLPTNQIVLYDLDTRRMNDGRSGATQVDHMSALVQSLNEKLSTVRDSAMGAFWLSDKVIVVWGASFMCTARHITREKKMKAGVEQVAGPAKQKKGKRSLDADQQTESKANVQRWSYWRSWLLTKYQPLLFVGTVPGSVEQGQAQQEMVVVERPYYDVSRNLPPTWFGGASYGS
jgi:U3 small nucleolar RNA-associated protein 4